MTKFFIAGFLYPAMVFASNIKPQVIIYEITPGHGYEDSKYFSKERLSPLSDLLRGTVRNKIGSQYTVLTEDSRPPTLKDIDDIDNMGLVQAAGARGAKLAIVETIRYMNDYFILDIKVYNTETLDFINYARIEEKQFKYLNQRVVETMTEICKPLVGFSKTTKITGSVFAVLAVVTAVQATRFVNTNVTDYPSWKERGNYQESTIRYSVLTGITALMFGASFAF